MKTTLLTFHSLGLIIKFSPKFYYCKHGIPVYTSEYVVAGYGYVVSLFLILLQQCRFLL